jgi:serine/threonine protein phosphatase PrpC
MKSHGVGESDIGRRRRRNEDSFVIDDQLGVYIVCDGIGGHSGGDIASATAAREAYEYCRDHRASTPNSLQLASEAVQHACRKVFEQGGEMSEHQRMGTTLTMLIVDGTKGIMAHVGDSRLYILRGSRVYQISSDHTYGEELRKKGGPKLLNKSSPFFRALTRTVGTSPSVEVDRVRFDLRAGDTFLLCSDGLAGFLDSPEELKEFLEDEDISSIPMKLVDFANARGGGDNITVAVVRIEDRESPSGGVDTAARTVNQKHAAASSSYLFKELKFRDLVRVIDIAECTEVEGGVELVPENGPCGSLYIVMDGRVSVYRADQETTQLGKGRQFGELSLLGAWRSPVSIRALGPTRLLRIDGNRFRELIAKAPRIGLAVHGALSRQMAKRMEDLGGSVFKADPRAYSSIVEPPFFT